jgi:pimeloyl-ACP methyl ester carboxylesterase
VQATPLSAFEPGDRAIGRPPLPPGQVLDLPGRGTTYVHHVAGPTDAPTIILLHGWTVTGALNWFRTFEPLSERFHVVTLDHRGHGRGIRSQERFSLEEAADDVAALAELLGIDSAIVAGYSMGGTVAQLAARRHRDLVSGLVLSATWSRMPPSRRDTRLLRMAGRAAAPTKLLSEQRQLEFIERGYALSSSTPPEDRPRWFVDEVAAAHVPTILEAAGEMARFDSRSWLPTLEVPTGVLITTRDTLISPDLQHELASHVPHAHIRHVATDHDGCVTNPDAFVPAFLELVEAVRRSDRA